MFKLPPWAATTPKSSSSLIDAATGNSIPTHLKSAYVFGTDPSNCDVCLPAVANQPPHQAAALVHHSDGRTFVISLYPSAAAAAASLDGSELPLNKPTALRKGAKISFGAAASFTFDCEEGGATTAARATASGPSSVRASHLLVKHSGSRRPSSWKEPVVTRPLEEAQAMVAAFREQISKSSDLAAAFAALAAVESHCSSARSGGDLGCFRRGQMQRVFEEAAFSLGVGEMSGLVASDSAMNAHALSRACIGGARPEGVSRRRGAYSPQQRSMLATPAAAAAASPPSFVVTRPRTTRGMPPHRSLSRRLLVPNSSLAEDAGVLADSGGGGGNSGGSGSGGKGLGGDGKGDSGSGENEGDENAPISAATIAATFGAAALSSLPKDMSAAASRGALTLGDVKRWLSIASTPVVGNLAKAWPGFRDRVLGNPRFLLVLAIEEAIGCSARMAGEIQGRGEKFWDEAALVASDMSLEVLGDFAIVWLLSPKACFKPRADSALTRAMRSLPSHAMQVGSAYKLQQRLGALALRGAQFFAVGFGAAAVGHTATIAAVSAQRKKGIARGDKQTAANTAPLAPALDTAMAWGWFMGISSNARYQLVNGFEERVLDVVPMPPLPRALATFVLRFGNTFVGTKQWMWWAKWIGVQ